MFLQWYHFYLCLLDIHKGTSPRALESTKFYYAANGWPVFWWLISTCHSSLGTGNRHTQFLSQIFKSILYLQYCKHNWILLNLKGQLAVCMWYLLHSYIPGCQAAAEACYHRCLIYDFSFFEQIENTITFLNYIDQKAKYCGCNSVRTDYIM